MLYIFDLDATLRVTKSGKVCPNDPEDQVPIPGVFPKLYELKRLNHRLVGNSNQGGVACGFMLPMVAWKTAIEFNNMIGNVLDDVKLEFYHKTGKFRDRFLDRVKPKPDMILDCIDDAWVTDKLSRKHQVIVVGDGLTDKEAAEKAEVQFIWAHEFFSWQDDWWEETKYGKGFIPSKWQDAVDWYTENLPDYQIFTEGTLRRLGMKI